MFQDHSVTSNKLIQEKLARVFSKQKIKSSQKLSHDYFFNE